MISGLADSVLVTFIVFCRIGACLMLMPGFSRSSSEIAASFARAKACRCRAAA